MAVVKTHTGMVVTGKGLVKKKLHQTPFSWVVSACESYNKETGLRTMSRKRRLLLETIEPIKKS